MKKDINKLREDIDQIDEKIKDLFLERMEIAKEILSYKKEQGLDIINAPRAEEKREAIFNDENIVVRKFYPDVNEALMNAYIAYQRDLTNCEVIFEKTRRIAYFGTGASNTYIALVKMLFDDGYKKVNNVTFYKKDEEVELVESRTMEDLETKLIRKEVDQAFIPYVNSNTGVVMDTFNLMNNINFKFIALFKNKIALYLYIAKENKERINSLYDIETIYSNLNALNQCSDCIVRYMPFATYRKSYSTVQSIEDMLKDKKHLAACIANEAANQDERVIKYQKETVSNDKGTETTFLLISYLEDTNELLSKKRSYADYFTGYFLYLSRQNETKAFSVESKSYRIVEVKKTSEGLKMFIYTIGEKAKLISHSSATHIYKDKVTDDIVLEYDYETESKESKVCGLAYIRGKEEDLRNPSYRIKGKYEGRNNGKAGTLEYRRLSKKEFDLLMGKKKYVE